MLSLRKITRQLYYNFIVCSIVFSSFACLAQNAPSADSITVSIAPEYDRVSKLHRFLFGESYRKLWAAPVKLRVLDFTKERGGLKILQKGGGMQTRSLRLLDPDGKEWVLRTIQKYPERGLPENLRATVARDILQDQVASVHPFSPLTVPPLAAALGIPHSSPEIIYVGDDPGLGEWRKEFANSAYLFEEREPLDVNDTDNTAKVQKELMDDNDHTADQKVVLRARLLDMLLGDWDRHEDQWRWQKVKDQGETIYTPIPRDRDHVYFKTSGLFPWIVSHQWLKSKFQPYDDEIRDIKGWNFNARYFDRYFLNGLSEKDWKEEIAYVQKTITDELITRSLRLMPDTIYAFSGEGIARKMRARREKLSRQALDYYEFISKTVEIPTSDKSEYFEIKHKDGGEIEIEVSNIRKDKSKGRKVYDRTFNPGITDEVRVYGFGSENVFSVIGNNPSTIRVRMIGGPEADSFYVDKDLQNKSKIYIYDQPASGNVLPQKSQARIRLSSDSAVHDYNRLAFKYNRKGPMVLANFNADLGLLLSLGIISEKQGFRRAPYAVKHELWGNYSIGRNSFLFNYSGEFKRAIGDNDLSIDLISRGPGYVSNFFGTGNETVFPDQGNRTIDYYRNRYEYLTGDVRLHNYWLNGIKVSAGLGAEYYTSSSSNNLSRFFNEYDALRPEEDVFGERFFSGIVAGVNHDTRMGTVLPWGGMYWNTQLRLMKQWDGDKDTYGKIASDVNFYVTLLRDTSFVMTNRLGGGITVGDPAFFQQMQLGGGQNLRGFRTNRFTGKSMIYHNLELRTKLFDFTSYITPGSVGLIGFNDIGRVWAPGETSERWHHGYGGGIYIVPAELILIQGLVAFSKEGTQPYISFGFRF